MSLRYIDRIAIRRFNRISKEHQCRVALHLLKEELDSMAENPGYSFLSLGEAARAAVEVAYRYQAYGEVVKLLHDFLERNFPSSKDKKWTKISGKVSTEMPEFLDEISCFWDQTCCGSKGTDGYELLLVLYHSWVVDAPSWNSIICDAISRAFDKKSLNEADLNALEEWIIDPRTPVEFQRVMRRIHAKNEPIEIFIERIKVKHTTVLEKE